MRGKGGGFGVLVLLIVVLVVMILAARSWTSVAPTARQITDPGSSVDDRGQPEAGDAVRSGNLPDLDEMRQSTDEHSSKVQEALENTE